MTERVREIETGVDGKIVRVSWEVDLQDETSKAIKVYWVKFEDGREKRCYGSDLIALS